MGGGLGYLSSRNCRTYDKCDTAGFAIPLGGVFGGLFGGTIGFISAYKWEPVRPNM